MDAVASHDWRGVERHGDATGLARRKPHFATKCSATTWEPANEILLNALKPAHGSPPTCTASLQH